VLVKATRYIPHYAIEEWERWEGRWELWFGVPVAMESQAKSHSRVVSNLERSLREQVDVGGDDDCRVSRGIDWRIASDMVVCPEVSIVCGTDDERWIMRTPTLIAEVLSPSTQLKDRNQKRLLYQQQGVKYYAMLDPEGEQFQVLRFDGNMEVGLKPGGDGRFSVELHEGCALVLDPTAVWIA